MCVDIRFPVTEKKESVIDGINKNLPGFLKMEVYDYLKPVYMPKEGSVIQMFLDTYRSISGDISREPKVIGGATYARSMENIVAFGPLFPGQPERAHMQDECISIEDLIKISQIYAKVLHKLVTEY